VRWLTGSAALAVCLLVLVVPAAAASTVTIGSDNLNSESPDTSPNCDSHGCTEALVQLTGQQITAPCAGTITSWSVNAYTFGGVMNDDVELRVLVPGTAGAFAAAGTSAPIVVTTTDAVHTAATDLPVAAGDYIALQVPDNRVFSEYGENSSAMGGIWDPPLIDGAAASAPDGTGGFEVLISAVVACTEELSVTNAEPAGGVVKSVVGSIDCGSTCSSGYPSGTVVSLSATPDAGYVFSGWTGACTGTGPCSITMNTAESVTAAFAVALPGTKITAASITAKRGKARFAFKAVGIATGFQCALAKVPKKGRGKPHASYGSCRSPKSYSRLRAGSYEFFVRAVNAAGVDPSPATWKFKISG
jgi:uncharacterized repeat protein (TIGR02543 family)